MARIALRREEQFGLALALAAHAGLVALLVANPPRRQAVPMPERVTVTISPDVGLTATSPEPAADAAPDVAPQIGDPAPPAEAVEESKPEPAQAPPKPAPVPKVQPKPDPAKAVVPPKPVIRPEPRPSPRPSPRPVERKAAPVVKPSPRPVVRATPAPARATPAPVSARAAPVPAARTTAPAASRPAARPATRPATTSGTSATAAPTARSGGSRIGNDFLKGVPGAQSAGKAQAAPAASIGPAVRSSLAGAISRQLKPHWTAPQGVDAELLVTVLSFALRADGTLDGRPQVVRQEGLTDANRAQAARHAEQAIRAVQLAAPFDLPEQYYDGWKRVSAFRFDRRLSQ